MDDFTENVAAQVATNLIKDSINKLFSPVQGLVGLSRARFLENFEDYCTYMYEKSSRVRTLFSKNKPLQLEDLYVETTFTTGKKSLIDTDLIKRFDRSERIIVKGNGGSGKTFFLRYLWLNRFKNPNGKIPVFIELRRVSDLATIDLLSFCRAELQSELIFGKGVFDKLCEDGRFEFIFDGFDEVAKGNRKSIEKQILEMSDRYRQCGFLVSGREDDRFSSWGSFTIYTVEPLTLEGVRKLIEKIPFDRKVKAKFVATLNDDFYRMHTSFLSSPLLAIMMLMTFNENAVIPRKLTSFYRDAFQTLLTWHDATKDSFDRERSLEVDEFRKIFSTFCLISYYDQVFDFDEQKLREYISKSLRYHRLENPIDDVKEDFCESVNLLQKDGLKFVFVHRSFQEYFAAECAMQTISGKAKEFLEVFSRRQRDSVLSMCYEIHPELVYDEFISEISDFVLSSNFIKMKKSKDLSYLREMNPTFKATLNLSRGTVQLIKFSIPDLNSDHCLEKMEIFNLLAEYSLGPNPTFTVFDQCFTALRHLLRDFQKKSACADGVQLDVSIKLGTGPVKLSVRNRGEVKLPADALRTFKTQLREQLKPRLEDAEEHVERYVRLVESNIHELRDARERKEQSIDDILGISAS